MSRVLVLGRRPYHLTAEEADTWMRREAERLVDVEAIERVALTWLQGASKEFAAPWHWMLELYLSDGAEPALCLDGGACAELLLDLRLLGMGPEVLLADGPETAFWEG